MTSENRDNAAVTQRVHRTYDGSSFRKAVEAARIRRTNRTTWGMRNPLQLWRVRPTRQP